MRGDGGGGVQDEGDGLGFVLLAAQDGDPGAVDVRAGPGMSAVGPAMLAEAVERGGGAVDVVPGGGEVRGLGAASQIISRREVT